MTVYTRMDAKPGLETVESANEGIDDHEHEYSTRDIMTTPQLGQKESDPMIERMLIVLSIIIVVLFFPFSLACIFILRDLTKSLRKMMKSIGHCHNSIIHSPETACRLDQITEFRNGNDTTRRIFIDHLPGLDHIPESVRQFERIVILRNGKVHGGRCYGPGMICYLPCIDSIKYIDLRIMCDNIPPEECLTKDSLTLTVQAVVYYRVIDPLWSIINVADFKTSTQYLAATALRNTIGRHRLSELLINRAEISTEVLAAMKQWTTKWGVVVIRIEMDNISIPLELKQAMATEAVSLRLTNAHIMVAESEIECTNSLEKATTLLMDNPLAMQLRYLQSLQSIAGDQTHTIVFPYSKDMLQSVFGIKNNIK